MIIEYDVSSIFILTNLQDVIKLGVGIHEDGEAIKECFGIQCDGLVDLSILSIKNGLTTGKSFETGVEQIYIVLILNCNQMIGYYSLKVLAQDLLKVRCNDIRSNPN